MKNKIIVILLLLSTISGAVTNPDGILFKKKTKREWKMTKFQVGFGLTGSVLYLSRNIKEDNDALGYTFAANYGGERYLRLSVYYTYYKPINIEPTWYTIKANTIEANLEILARFKNNKTFLYPLCGLSYNTFQGYFTGQDDFLHLKEHFKSNTTIKSNWAGLNIGTGIEHSIGMAVLFFEYRMRLGGGEKAGRITIMDVCYGGGVRLKIYKPVKTIKKKSSGNFGKRYDLTK